MRICFNFISKRAQLDGAAFNQGGYLNSKKVIDQSFVVFRAFLVGVPSQLEGVESQKNCFYSTVADVFERKLHRVTRARYRIGRIFFRERYVPCVQFFESFNLQVRKKNAYISNLWVFWLASLAFVSICFSKAFALVKCLQHEMYHFLDNVRQK